MVLVDTGRAIVGEETRKETEFGEINNNYNINNNNYNNNNINVNNDINNDINNDNIITNINNNNVSRWSIFEAILVFFLVLGKDWLFPFPEMSWFYNFSRILSPEKVIIGELFLVSIINAALFFILIGLIIKLRYRLSWSDIGLRAGRREKWLLFSITQGFLLFVIISIIGIIVSNLFKFKVQPQEVAEMLSIASTGRERVLALLIGAVIAPLSEELYFRGFLFPAVKKMTGTVPAVILTSAFFGFLHFDVIRFLPITLAGIWLNVIYIKTESLYASMIVHSVWNAIMICLLFLAQSAGTL
jgi:membrane protease YdiL (CAAX protease family)